MQRSVPTGMLSAARGGRPLRRRIVQLSFEHIVPVELDALFAFHSDPANLALLLEGWRGFRLLRHEHSIRVGAEVWIEQTLAGAVPIVMGFRHVVCEPPARFGEELVHGPFERFIHLHEFDAVPGGTRVRDVLDVCARRECGGELATRFFVAPVVRRMFLHRHSALERLARDANGGSILRRASRGTDA